jgi:hypothetical protein
MDHRISFFGGETRGFVRLANGDEQAVDIVRDVWFDRDIDGRWLVWAQDRDGIPLDGTDEGSTGAIVVRNRDVIAFLEQLGQLIVEPAAFEHEPVFAGVDGAVDRTTPQGA